MKLIMLLGLCLVGCDLSVSGHSAYECRADQLNETTENLRGKPLVCRRVGSKYYWLDVAACE